MNYKALEDRYINMKYNRCGKSGLKLPAVSLGLWHNFGSVDVYKNSREIVLRAFDLGVTHIDLANNYGPVPGSAEETFGKILKDDLQRYRDEMIISTKAGYDMWPGPYGEWGSRKYLISSLNQSLKRMGLEYVDIFYHHRPDPDTPLEETASALDFTVRSGKALYAGISNYRPEETAKMADIMKKLGTPLLIHQPNYNMFDRWIENGLLTTLKEKGMGSIVFSPLAQGILTDRYLKGIPVDSRAAKSHGFLKKDSITTGKIEKIRALNQIALDRGQTLAQLALVWNLRHDEVTSVLIGASRVEQLENNIAALNNLNISDEELAKIEKLISKDE